MELKEAYSILISGLIKQGYLKSDNIISTFFKIQRWEFLPEELKKFSTSDEPIPLGYGQTMSAPHMVAIMLELLDIKEGENILEVGTGSGWNTALMAELTGPGGSITTIEYVKELHEQAKKNLDEFFNVECIHGDGKKGYKQQAPYDKIIVTCAAKEIPKDLENQLADGGIVLIPVGSVIMQELIKGTKKGKWIEKENGGLCKFVPMV
ncbi:MAG: protein-L-isoaspartate O-methyltransferase [Candidatus Aenigmarchaeota archaeon]|nr:protein-L-isoaspartate O-methyltransferase [Candidatus Aenigmarchaeota archaeon]